MYITQICNARLQFERFLQSWQLIILAINRGHFIFVILQFTMVTDLLLVSSIIVQMACYTDNLLYCMLPLLSGICYSGEWLNIWYTLWRSLYAPYKLIPVTGTVLGPKIRFLTYMANAIMYCGCEVKNKIYIWASTYGNSGISHLVWLPADLVQ